VENLIVASSVEFVILDGGPANGLANADLPSGVTVVALSSGLAAIPVSDELLAGLAAGAPDDDRVRPGWMLRRRLCGLARELSAERRVVYVAGETFGGLGCQEAVGWHKGQVVFGPAGTCDSDRDRLEGYRVVRRADGAINVGLRNIGLHAADGMDEYATAGLNQHRFTSDWLND
jgi:hypothetical protein